ncbi:hypothetical protein ACWIGW_28240 [Nocardia brasiliensis]
MLEDPPLFASQSVQALGPMFALWAKWLGPARTLRPRRRSI